MYFSPRNIWFLELSACVGYFHKGKNISFSSSILLRFLLYVLFIVLEYEALVDELRDNFETINARKKCWIAWLFVNDSRFAYVQLPHELCLI